MESRENLTWQWATGHSMMHLQGEEFGLFLELAVVTVHARSPMQLISDAINSNDLSVAKGFPAKI